MSIVRSEAGTSIGTYVLERKLGAGGMAEVYLARRSGPRGFTKRVAIKRILPELSEDSQLIQMFCDEARVAGTLSHPNIAQVLEFGEHEGEFFIVMEYVDGVSCSTLLRTASGRGERLPVGGSLYIVREVLLALAFAHEATDESGRALHIVHRDVSPSNVLVSRVGNVKLIDFGITRSLLGERRTVPGELKGKLRYMSPEQILGADVDARSDLFAAGVMLAEMLAGRVLFQGKSDLEILTRISRGELGLVRDGGIPKDLGEVLERALAHRPGDRFQEAREFARAIEDAAAARGLRLDDTTIVPYLHAVGFLSSASGTRPAAAEPRVPARPPPLPGARNASPRAGSGAASRPAPVARPTPAVREMRPEPASPAVALEMRPKLAAEAAAQTPHVEVELVASRPGAPSEQSSHPVPLTRERSSGTYRIRTRSGAVVGPVPRTELLALIATGRLSARSNVSIKADAFVPAGNVPALSALATHPAYRFRDDDATSPDRLERIDAVTLPTALFGITLGRETGLFVAVDGKRRKRVFFDKGDPVFIASTDRDELLGRRLVAARVVSERGIERALGSQPPFRLGEALVAVGAIGAAQLVRELSEQLQDRLLALGGFRAGELRFYAGVSLDQSHHVRTREATLSIVTNLVREQYAAGDIAALLRPIIKEVLAPTAAHRARLPLLGLTDAEAGVLGLAAGRSTVRDVVTRSTQAGVPMADALRAVFIGLCSGCLEASSWPPPPGPARE